MAKRLGATIVGIVWVKLDCNISSTMAVVFDGDHRGGKLFAVIKIAIF